MSNAATSTLRDRDAMADQNSHHVELAYQNESFLEGEDGRPVRILAEYLEPLTRFRLANVRDTVVFVGSSRLACDGPLGYFYRDARELARLLTLWSKSLA